MKILDTDSFAIYHPRVGAYIREAWGYGRTRWRNLITKLGPDQQDIIRLAYDPGKRGVACGLELNVQAFGSGERHRLVTDEVLALYRERLKELNIARMSQLTVRRMIAREAAFRKEEDMHELVHTYDELNDQQKTAVPPPLRVAVSLLSPPLGNSFDNRDDLVYALMIISGQEFEQVDASMKTLQRHRLLRSNRTEDGKLRLRLRGATEPLIRKAIDDATQAT